MPDKIKIGIVGLGEYSRSYMDLWVSQRMRYTKF